jgi:hypothetical protein
LRYRKRFNLKQVLTTSARVQIKVANTCLLLGINTMLHQVLRTTLLTIISIASFALGASGGNATIIQQDVDYTRLESPLDNGPQLILVFRYRNESSYRLYRILSQQGYSVTLWPAVLRESWRPEAKLALMANQLKASYQQHLQLFETLQSQPQDSFQLDSFRQLLKGIGIREEAIEPVLFDSDIPKQLKRQLNLLEKFSISSVPTIIFKGQYVITAEQAKTPAHLLAILEFLESQTL